MQLSEFLIEANAKELDECSSTTPVMVINKETGELMDTKKISVEYHPETKTHTIWIEVTDY